MPIEYERLMSVVRDRRSIRRFRPDPISADQLEKILEAARWAPTASNRQAFRFLIVQDRVLIEEMAAAVQTAIDKALESVRADIVDSAKAYGSHFVQFRNAPLVIVAIYRTVEVLPLSTNFELDAVSSVASAITHILLAAHALGLGGCWMTGPLVAEQALRAQLDVPEGWKVAALVPVGVPDETPTAPARRSLDRLCQKRTAKPPGERG